MGVRLDRRGIIARGKRDEALAFAAEVSAYVTEKWAPVSWGAEIGGTNGAIHWYSDYDSLAHMEQIFMATLTDEGYVNLLDAAADLFEAPVEDTITMIM